MFTVLAHWAELARTAAERRRATVTLHELSDRQLDDLGIVRGMIDDHVRDGLPWPASAERQPAWSGASLQGCG